MIALGRDLIDVKTIQTRYVRVNHPLTLSHFNISFALSSTLAITTIQKSWTRLHCLAPDLQQPPLPNP